MGGWGGLFAAMPEGYLKAEQQYQQMADEEAQRQLHLQQYQTNQRQAPLQDQFLQAQIAHMRRPDINAQRYADERAGVIQGAALSPYADLPGATPMPQPPQTSQAFQGAQPMQGVSPGMPQQQPQGQPGAIPQPQPMPQGQPQAMYQPQQPQGQPQQPQGQPQQPQGQPQQPQGQPGPVPQAQAMPAADPVSQWEQQMYGQLQQRIQSLPPARSQQEQYTRALGIQQAQQQIQARAKGMRDNMIAQARVAQYGEAGKMNEWRQEHGDAELGQKRSYQDESLELRKRDAARKEAAEAWKEQYGDKVFGQRKLEQDRNYSARGRHEDFQEWNQMHRTLAADHVQAWRKEFQERGLTDREASEAWRERHGDAALAQHGSIAERNAAIREKQIQATGQRFDARQVQQREALEKRLHLQKQLADLSSETRKSEGAANRSATDIRAAKQRALTERDTDERAYTATLPSKQEYEEYKAELDRHYQATLKSIGDAKPVVAGDVRSKLNAMVHAKGGEIDPDTILSIGGKNYKVVDDGNGNVDYEPVD